MRYTLVILYILSGILTAGQTIRIGAYDNPPKIYMSENGQLTGFWYEITIQIAENENWNVEWIYGSWDECLHRLENNEIDVMVDTGVTPARQKLYLFNDETVYLSWTKIYRSRSADIQSVLDLESRSIGGLKNSFDLEGPDGLKKILRDFQINAKVSELNSYKEIFSYLEHGIIDAGIVDKDFGADNETRYKIYPTSIVLQPARMQYAFNSGSEKAVFLKDKFDKNLKELKSDKNSVYYAAMDNFFNKKPVKKFEFPFWLKVVLYSSGALIIFLLAGSFLMRREIKRKTQNLLDEIISREKTEGELKASENKFRGLIEFAADGILIGSHEGIVTDANQSICSLFGMDRKEIIGNHISKMPFTEESIKKSPLRFDLLNQGKSVLSERVIKRHDGSEINIEMKTKMMGDGTYQSIYRDITERKKIENELKEKEEKYSKLVDNISDGIGIVNEREEFIFANRTADSIFEVEVGSLVSRNLSSFLSEYDQKRMTEETSRRKKGESSSYELDIITAKNNKRTIYVKASPYYDNKGRIIATYGVFYDITEKKKSENALKRSEEKYRLLVENQNDLVVKTTTDNKFLYVSPSYCKIFGRSEDELIGKEFTPLVHQEDLSKTLEEMKKLFQPPYTCYVEQRALSAEGWRWFGWSDKAILDDDGSVKEIIGVGRDITEKYEYIRQIQEQEHVITSLSDNIPNCIVYQLDTGLNGEKREFKYVSAAVEKLYGFTQEQVLKDSSLIFSLIHPEDAQVMVGLSREAAETMSPLYCEIRIITPQGDVRWKMLSLSPRLMDNGHKIWDGIELDITDKKNAELALKDSEEKFRTLFEESNDAIYLMDGGTFIECNPRSVQMFGCSEKSDLIDHKPTDFSPEFQPDGRLSSESAAAYISLALSGSHQRFYWKHCRKDRTIFDAEVSLDRLILKGKTYLQAIVIDISFRIEAERRINKINESLEQKVKERTAQLSQANQELESFSYSVSHDLRAPVRHIMGFTDILKRELDDCSSEKTKELLNKVILSAGKMEGLIDDLLNFSRTSTREMNKENIDMNRVVKDAVKEITHNSYTFSIEWKIADLPHVQADRNLMQSVWMNLIDNAIKYTKKIEKPVIEIGFSEYEKEYEFFIKDNGVGFEMEYSHKLFGVFQRLHLEKDYPGTGIGLANVKRIIIRHGGMVRGESDGKTGASFYFTLPKS